MSTFDPHYVVAGVVQCEGSFNHLRVTQPPGGPGEWNNLVIDPTQPFNVEMEWQLDGTLNGAGNVLQVLAGISPPRSWRVDLYAEKMGPGPDQNLFNVANAVPIGPEPTTLPARWNYVGTVPANTLPEHAGPGQSGVYKLVAVVFANSTPPAGTPDIIGFYEGPMILSENLA